MLLPSGSIHMNKRLPLLVLLLLTLASLAPGAAAQPEFPAEYVRADLTTSTGFVEVPWQETRTVGWTLNDRSGDNWQGADFPHRFIVTAEVQEETAVGWRVAPSPTSDIVRSGQSVHGRLVVEVDPMVRERSVTVDLTVELMGRDGQTVTETAHVQARVAPYHQGQVSVVSQPQRLAPLEAEIVQLEVENEAPYPDTYELDLDGPPGWSVNAPDQVTLMAHETRRVDAIVVAPHGDDRFYYQGDSDLVRVSISSVNDPSSTTLDETAHMVRVQGLNLPPYTWPFFPLGLLLAGAFAYRRRRVFERSRKERGPPRDPQLTPKQEALLAELKGRDPERYRALKERIEAERDRREELYPEHREAQQESLLDEGNEGEGEDA